MTEYRTVASAPGKIILFGEHAVVHGVTAVAASLSDLRIFVDVTSTLERQLSVNLHDFDHSGEQKEPYIVKYDDLRQTLTDLITQSDKGSPLSPENPQEKHLAALRSLFGSYPIHAAHGLMAIGYLVVKLLPELLINDQMGSSSSRTETLGLSIDVKSIGLPIGGGLGSSAAFSVSLSGALLRLRQKMFNDVYTSEVEESVGDEVVWPKSIFDQDFILKRAGVSPKNEDWLKTINGWAYAAEVVIHGAPSGLDNTTSCYGGALKYQRSKGNFDRMEYLPSFKILLTNTKVPRSTKVLVAGVKDLYDRMPGVIQPIFNSIEDISQRFLTMAKKTGDGDEAKADTISEMAELFRINHCLLNAVGVGHHSLDEVFAASARHGLACKLTGAGGGGCAITLLDDCKKSWVEDREALRKDIESLGYETFLSSIGGDGVMWHK